MSGAGPSLRAQLNVFWLLVCAAFTPRNRRDDFRLVWIFVEPIGQLAALLLIFSLIGRVASYGDSFALFLLTGVATLTLFSQTGGLVAGAIANLDSPNRLPIVGPFHEALAAVVFNLVVASIYVAVIAYAIGVFERRDTAPAHPPVVVAAFLWTVALAFGVGLIRGYARTFLPVVERAYNIASRILIFVSGVFFVPSFMPPQLRDVLAWNPLVHCVELMRLGFYAEYPTIVYDAAYLRGCAGALVTLGVLLVWRRRAVMMG